MDSPLPTSTGFEVNATGPGLAAGVAAPAAPTQTNEAGTVAHQPAMPVVGTPSPRLVIRGENHSSEPNPAAAFVDWLNFTFPLQLSGNGGLMELDVALRKSFGFGVGANRNKKHLNYEHSWELDDGYGIFGTGGDSVAGTSLISLSGEGCSVVKNWLAVHDFLNWHKARITRVDLTHDDYVGRISLESVRNWFEAGDFHSGKGRPPTGRFIDDFGSGEGKTLYVGKRKNGKMLRIYEKGKQLGDPESPWVRWELQLHNKDRVIPIDALINPARYLAAAYPTTAWINERQSRIETATRSTEIGLDVLTEYCQNSYGKLIWTLQHVVGHSPEEIVEMLAVEGIPSRINHAVPGEV